MSLKATFQMMRLEKSQGGSSGFDSGGSRGHIMHLDRKLFQMVDTRIQFLYKELEFGSYLHVQVQILRNAFGTSCKFQRKLTKIQTFLEKKILT